MSTFKNYTIIKSLGQGGMAEVLLAEDNRFHSKVAIKILSPEFSLNSNISQRFLAEARNLFKMSHQNIVRVTDLIEDDGKKAFVMEYIEGESLKSCIDRGNISKDKLVFYLSQMLDALGYCHKSGLIHRDIKPSNFMVNKDGHIKLLDFGISKDLNKSGEYTHTGTSQMLGTPVYMSPEQVLETRAVDERSDIYSLGVVLWQMISGHKPYDSNTLSAFQIQSKIVNEPLSLLNSEMDGIIQKCTDKDPNKRFANCEEIKRALANPSSIHVTSSDSYSDKTVIVQAGGQNIQRSNATRSSIQTDSIKSNLKESNYPLNFTNGPVYNDTFDLNSLSHSDKINYQKNQFLTTFNIGSAILLHFLTFGIFTTISCGLKHSKLPRVKENDFSAGKAFGFLFIPFFNIYWLFVFWRKLAKRINLQFRLRRLAPPISMELVTTICIMNFLPFGIFVNFFILLPVVLGQIQSACNKLALENIK